MQISEGEEMWNSKKENMSEERNERGWSGRRTEKRRWKERKEHWRVEDEEGKERRKRINLGE